MDEVILLSVVNNVVEGNYQVLRAAQDRIISVRCWVGDKARGDEPTNKCA
jgi:hypothetical protein